MILEFEVEPYAVHRVRAAVNVKHQRILLRRIEVRWLNKPTLNLLAANRVVPQLLDLPERDSLKQIVVHPDDSFRCWLLMTENHHASRSRRTAHYTGRHATVRKRADR